MGSYRIEVHVSPNGSPLGDGTLDYPTRTLESALDIARRTRTHRQPVVIWMHAGSYPLFQTLILTEQDSDTTFAAWDDEEVRICGGTPLTTWHKDMIAGRRVWVSDIAQTAGRTLYVDGSRIPRPRVPHSGLMRVGSQDGLDVHSALNATLFEGSGSFTFDAGQLRDEGIDVIQAGDGMEAVIPHFWIEERLPIRDIDVLAGTIDSDYRTMLCLKDGDGDAMAGFYLDGVAEALGRYPHEWLLDRAGTIGTAAMPNGYGRPVAIYVPEENENIADFSAIVPAVGQLVVIRGQADEGVAHDIRFEGVSFVYADWNQAPAARPPFQMREDPVLDPDALYASDPQAASSVPGCVELSYAHGCAFVDCRIAHVGGYGIRLGDGVRGTLVSGCLFEDLGAGAISCGGGCVLRKLNSTPAMRSVIA